MPKLDFSKPALNISQQISKLTKRGMIINNIPLAEKKLSELNYYRLEGYWLPLEADHTNSQFIDNVTFELLMNWYDIDLSIRSILFEAISNIEVSFRTKWAYFLSTKYEPFSYLNPKYAKNREKWINTLNSFSSDLFRSKEVFVKHFIDNFKEFFPPEWAAAEIMSFGTLSHMYQNLNEEPPLDTTDLINPKLAIAQSYRLTIKQLESWMKTINVCRNTCAHQSRIISSYSTSQPSIPNPNNAIYSLWNYQYRSNVEVTVIIPSNACLRTVTKVELKLKERNAVGELPTGLLFYLPDNSSMQTGTIIENLPNSTMFFLPIGSKIEVLTDTVFKIPIGTLIIFPSNYATTPSINNFCTKENYLWYNTILLICYLYETITGSDLIRKRISTLLRTNLETSHLFGFPPNWELLPYWN